MFNFNVLAAEDDPDLMKYMYGDLRHLENVHVDFATSEMAAMNYIMARRYDLAFIDIQMREDDRNDRGGIAIIRALKELREGTSVVVVSGTKAIDAAISAFQAGIVNFLEKGKLKNGAATVKELVVKFIDENRNACPNLLGPFNSVAGLLSYPEFIPIWEGRMAEALGTDTTTLRAALHSAFDGRLPVLRSKASGKSFVSAGDPRAMVGTFWSRKLGEAVRVGLCSADLEIDRVCGGGDGFMEIHSKEYHDLKLKVWQLASGVRQEYDWVQRSKDGEAPGGKYPF